MTHVTPKSYLSFLEGYKTIYKQKKDEIGELAQRMNTGLEKLLEAGESVAMLRVELEEKEKELAIANERAAEVLKEPCWPVTPLTTWSLTTCCQC